MPGANAPYLASGYGLGIEGHFEVSTDMAEANPAWVDSLPGAGWKVLHVLAAEPGPGNSTYADHDIPNLGLIATKRIGRIPDALWGIPKPAHGPGEAGLEFEALAVDLNKISEVMDRANQLASDIHLFMDFYECPLGRLVPKRGPEVEQHLSVAARQDDYRDFRSLPSRVKEETEGLSAFGFTTAIGQSGLKTIITFGGADPREVVEQTNEAEAVLLQAGETVKKAPLEVVIAVLRFTADDRRQLVA